MLKYYLMAIEYGNINAINNLACYYDKIIETNNIVLMHFYFQSV